MLPVIQLDKPAAPQPRRSYARLSLRWFLVLSALVPLIIGLYVRWEMSRIKGYHVREVAIPCATRQRPFDSYQAYASWRVDGFGRESLIYLVVQPPGDRGSSGGGPGNYEAPLVRGPPVWDDLAVEPNHVYCGGKQLSNDRFPTVWLYLTSSQLKETSPGFFETRQVQVQQLKIPRAELQISQAEFARLSETELWKKHLEPTAEAEGDRWWQLHRKRFGLDD